MQVSNSFEEKKSKLKFYVFIQIKFTVDANEYYKRGKIKFVMQNNLIGNINICKCSFFEKYYFVM